MSEAAGWACRRAVEGHGPVLGIFEGAEYCTGYCATAAQDLVILFTDGMFEIEIANGEFYGQERLLAAVRDRIRLPSGELFGEVLAEVQERRVWREFEDDVCLVGMEGHAHGHGWRQPESCLKGSARAIHYLKRVHCRS